VSYHFDIVFVARSKTKYLKSTYIEKVMRDMMLSEHMLKTESNGAEK
jgi:hypothetical protein